MLAKIFSGTTIGLDGVLIEVEVDVAGKGFPTFTIVGLPNKAIDEAKDRVRTSINNSGFEMPDSRLTINLAPANIPKEGSSFDLPIAIGILTASGSVISNQFNKSLFIGELSLEGKIKRVQGIISLALMAKNKKIKNLFVPKENVKEAAIVKEITVYPVTSLIEVVLHLNGQKQINPYPHVSLEELDQEQSYQDDFSEIRGQEQAKRALEIAAAGFHNIHLKGPPGAGKTMLSRAFPSIMPLMDRDEILEVSKIYSVLGKLSKSSFIIQRPFRSPHHTTSRIGLIGGGSKPKPGEISLAHRGVLFLDEFPEFPRSVLEALRQPLEDGIVTISRASGTLTFPARFLLVAASNPCPCGYLTHPKKRCKCMPGAILRYRKRLSGPMLDRIDLHIDVPPVEDDQLIIKYQGKKSSQIKNKVIKARKRQIKRLADLKIKTNGEMGTSEIRKYCHLTSEAINILKKAKLTLSLSARSYFKTIKVAQTIADLEEKDKIDSSCISESLQFRAVDD